MSPSAVLGPRFSARRLSIAHCSRPRVLRACWVDWSLSIWPQSDIGMGFEMTAIYIGRPFLLMPDNGAQRSFAAGEQEVEEAMATHRYVQAHCIEKPVAKTEPARWAET